MKALAGGGGGTTLHPEYFYVKVFDILSLSKRGSMSEVIEKKIAKNAEE